MLVVGCGKESSEPPATQAPAAQPAAATPEEPRARCVPVPFAASTPVPEASGAAWLELEGTPALVVIGDSGHDGAYGVIDPESGETRETGKLPLGDGAGEDLEGIAARGGRLHAITSAGWLRSWKRAGDGFELVAGPYALGPVDLPSRGGIGDKPPEGTGMVCDARGVNCGRNYEGLCLAEKAFAKGPCVGFAASKADGHLYCIVEDGERLAVRYAPRIRVTKPGAIADCAFADDGTLWVGSNLFDASQVYRVDGWQDPEHAEAIPFAKIGIGFSETLAVRGDVIYRMSDTGSAPSLMAKFRCER